jgi:CBS domain-containing membrane protein
MYPGTPQPAGARQIFRLFAETAITLALVFTCLRLLEAWLEVPTLLASFGALTVVMITLRDREVARLRNVLLGHLLPGAIGLACRLLVAPVSVELALIFAVSGSVAIMARFNAIHPPGGAIAMLLVLLPGITPQNGVQMVVAVSIGAALYFAIAQLVFLGSARLCALPGERLAGRSVSQKEHGI